MKPESYLADYSDYIKQIHILFQVLSASSVVHLKTSPIIDLLLSIYIYIYFNLFS